MIVRGLKSNISFILDLMYHSYKKCCNKNPNVLKNKIICNLIDWIMIGIFHILIEINENNIDYLNDIVIGLIVPLLHCPIKFEHSMNQIKIYVNSLNNENNDDADENQYNESNRQRRRRSKRKSRRRMSMQNKSQSNLQNENEFDTKLKQIWQIVIFNRGDDYVNDEKSDKSNNSNNNNNGNRKNQNKKELNDFKAASMSYFASQILLDILKYTHEQLPQYEMNKTSRNATKNNKSNDNNDNNDDNSEEKKMEKQRMEVESPDPQQCKTGENEKKTIESKNETDDDDMDGNNNDNNDNNDNSDNSQDEEEDDDIGVCDNDKKENKKNDRNDEEQRKIIQNNLQCILDYILNIFVLHKISKIAQMDCAQLLSNNNSDNNGNDGMTNSEGDLFFYQRKLVNELAMFEIICCNLSKYHSNFKKMMQIEKGNVEKEENLKRSYTQSILKILDCIGTSLRYIHNRIVLSVNDNSNNSNGSSSIVNNRFDAQIMILSLKSLTNISNGQKISLKCDTINSILFVLEHFNSFNIEMEVQLLCLGIFINCCERNKKFRTDFIKYNVVLANNNRKTNTNKRSKRQSKTNENNNSKNKNKSDQEQTVNVLEYLIINVLKFQQFVAKYEADCGNNNKNNSNNNNNDDDDGDNKNGEGFKEYSDSKALSHYYCLLLGFLMQQSDSYKAILQLWMNKYKKKDFNIILENIKQFWQYYQKMANYYQTTQRQLFESNNNNNNNNKENEISLLEMKQTINSPMYQNSRKQLETIQAIFQIVQIRNNSIVQHALGNAAQ